MSYFYSHLINIEPVLVKLEGLDLSEEQREHLAKLLDATIESTVLDFIFSQLKQDEKEIFVEMLKTTSDKGEMMEFLTVRIDNAQQQIYHTVDKLIEEFNKDIEEIRCHE
ncbi:MAG: hypothetical protein UU73_C0001G0310 [Candidatus Daviesbacteria bacterium GW2011_GWA1_41_61]|uniref:Uncharacterized protein n=1 Tax=Candidatus Daviesbacteria bacterium GW2011_GWA2_40_9 TaxID=1618424 RepID=A0A0G0WGV6_9BACT|nr:MAG: hypothetical protein UU26_C0029G0020 [Candidatus Daviesbacteria bacterium GW2011_GWC1_40_9]KKR83560.1 MAG: hypothetical protein UU29_C0004G0061 [Candidatus Daviesbacteria bacterium GW2011_GWA2_40_9]KKR93129.1 MAG: hypothetical protein UU44_C0004G0311 [Candidatus Daviesbacteria bacterium GW2011_GWB1_41_15]KKS15673.1 MAG: hypothetical protein UU73_C0001G0310 [Candidatus Daviesbacteria bacterium GW2011_GWA1_41_61]